MTEHDLFDLTPYKGYMPEVESHDVETGEIRGRLHKTSELVTFSGDNAVNARQAFCDVIDMMERQKNRQYGNAESRRALLALARAVHNLVGPSPADWRDAEAMIRRLAREAIEAVGRAGDHPAEAAPDA